LTLPKQCNRLWVGIRIQLSTLANVTKAITFELVLLVVNTFAAPSFKKVWEVFLHAADKYKKEYKKIPVLIIDNVNRLAKKQLRLLEHVQEYAKRAADEGIATVVFVTNEGHVPRRMMGILNLAYGLIRF
jgi:chromosomal replication initiation ATPase DnaA